MMNIGNVRAPFHYSNTYVRSHAFLGFKIPSRMGQGIVCGSEYFRLGEPSIGNDNILSVVIVKNYYY